MRYLQVHFRHLWFSVYLLCVYVYGVFVLSFGVCLCLELVVWYVCLWSVISVPLKSPRLLHLDVFIKLGQGIEGKAHATLG